jgi:hypothetical protein
MRGAVVRLGLQPDALQQSVSELKQSVSELKQSVSELKPGCRAKQKGPGKQNRVEAAPRPDGHLALRLQRNLPYPLCPKQSSIKSQTLGMTVSFELENFARKIYKVTGSPNDKVGVGASVSIGCGATTLR